MDLNLVANCKTVGNSLLRRFRSLKLGEKTTATVADGPVFGSVLIGPDERWVEIDLRKDAGELE